MKNINIAVAETKSHLPEKAQSSKLQHENCLCVVLISIPSLNIRKFLIQHREHFIMAFDFLESRRGRFSLKLKLFTPSLCLPTPPLGPYNWMSIKFLVWLRFIKAEIGIGVFLNSRHKHRHQSLLRPYF